MDKEYKSLKEVAPVPIIIGKTKIGHVGPGGVILGNTSTDKACYSYRNDRHNEKIIMEETITDYLDD